MTEKAGFEPATFGFACSSFGIRLNS